MFNIQSPVSRVQCPESSVHSPASGVQRPKSSFQSPAFRFQHPGSSVQSTASNSCVEGPGIPVCQITLNCWKDSHVLNEKFSALSAFAHFDFIWCWVYIIKQIFYDILWLISKLFQPFFIRCLFWLDGKKFRVELIVRVELKILRLQSFRDSNQTYGKQ